MNVLHEEELKSQKPNLGCSAREVFHKEETLPPTSLKNR